MAVSLPENPSREHLRNQARALQRAVRRADPTALRRVADQRVAWTGAARTFPLHAAQSVVAREYGFASWARLGRYLDVVAEHRWDTAEPAQGDEGGVGDAPAAGDGPGADEEGGARREGADGSDDPAGWLCRWACLTYTGDDGPHRWRRARQLLAGQQELTSTSIWAAAAAADAGAVGRLLAVDPGLARRRGGPYGWRPLFYLAYSRLYPAASGADALAVARALLAAGADPTEGYLWRGLPTPFTLITGVLGGGELGPVRQPAHPHAVPLARLLLSAGADANDGQALYNRMFEPDDGHLRLLFEFGLGSGDGGVWRRRLGEALDPPAELLRGQLGWAIDHGLTARVRLLLAHGVDVAAAYPDGRTPAARARLAGYPEIVDLLVAGGAAPPGPDPAEELIGAALRGDEAAVRALRAAYPEAVTGARRRRPGLVAWAAARGGGSGSVRLLAGLGFDVNALGRGDAPVEQPWETGLHRAAASGDVELARALLELGADPGLRDARFGATPLGWARHFERPELVELLAPLTPDRGEPA